MWSTSFSMLAVSAFPSKVLATNVSISTIAQQTIRGAVTSSQGAESGVTVSIKGNAASATQTDAQGVFSITAKKGDVLIFSAVGFKTQEVLVDSDMLKVFLVAQDESLEEVVNKVK